MDWLGWVTLGSTTIIALYAAVNTTPKIIIDQRDGVKNHELTEDRNHVIATNELIDQYQERRKEDADEIEGLKRERDWFRTAFEHEAAFVRLLIDFIYRAGLRPPPRDGQTYTGGRVPPNEVGE
mgnify:CR=1 FL=1